MKDARFASCAEDRGQVGPGPCGNATLWLNTGALGDLGWAFAWRLASRLRARHNGQLRSHEKGSRNGSARLSNSRWRPRTLDGSRSAIS